MMAGNDLNAQSARLAKRLAAIPAAVVAELRPALVKAADDLADTMKALAPEAEARPPRDAAGLEAQGAGAFAKPDNPRRLLCLDGIGIDRSARIVADHRH